MSFIIDTTRKYIIEDDGTRWTLPEAIDKQARHEAEAASWERTADRADREGRTIRADTARAMCAYHASLARDLFLVRQQVQREAA